VLLQKAYFRRPLKSINQAVHHRKCMTPCYRAHFVCGVSHGPRWAAFSAMCVCACARARMCVCQSDYVRTLERRYKNKVSSCRKLELVSLSCHHTPKIVIHNNVIDDVADVHVIGNTSRRGLAKKKRIECLPVDKCLAIKSALETNPFSCVGLF
jgi:hypothetical protein